MYNIKIFLKYYENIENIFFTNNFHTVSIV